MISALIAALLAGAAGAGVYAVAVEPRRLCVRENRFTLPGWPASSAPLRIVALADPHICEPWMTLKRLEGIVARANALKPDVIVLLGDYQPCYLPRLSRALEPAHWTQVLAKLSAPHGVYAILGNHDWWDRTDEIRGGFARTAIRLLENEAVHISRENGAFWLAGTASMDAVRTGRRGREGRDDLPGTLGQVGSNDPVILLAHEPDMFAKTDARVALTLSGHTHGGQVRLPFLGRPAVPSRYGQRFAYGPIVEDSRHLLVSGGLGCSFLPLRFRVPPEINLVTVCGAA